MFLQEDKYIPCKEAGLGFVKGDIIHIVSQVVVVGVVLGLVLVVILFHDYVDDDVEKDEDENDFDDVNVNDDIKL